MTLFTEDPIRVLLDGVDWLPLQGPIEERTVGMWATHVGFCRLNGSELTVFWLSDGSRVFDADSFEAAFDDS